MTPAAISVLVTRVAIAGFAGLLLHRAGQALRRQAARFIHDIEGTPPGPLPLGRALPGLFALLATVSLTANLYQGAPWLWSLRDVLLLAWCVSFTLLDLARCWLPLPFTLNFALSGLLLGVLPDAVSRPLPGLVGALLLAGLLLSLRAATQRAGRERLGLGDVWLLCGLCLWLPLTAVAMLTAMACALMALTLLTCRHRCVTAGVPHPFAPSLCLMLCISTLAPAHLGLY